MIRNPERICSAHKTNGDPCGQYAARGTNICRYHGAAAPQVKAAASRRLLEELVGPALVQLQVILVHENTPPAVRLAAAKDILNRVGLTAPKQVEVITFEMIDAEITRLEDELGIEHGG